MTLLTHTLTNKRGIEAHSHGASKQAMADSSYLCAESGSACCSRRWGLSVSPAARDQFAKSVAVLAVLEKEGGASVQPMATTNDMATNGSSPSDLGGGTANGGMESRDSWRRWKLSKRSHLAMWTGPNLGLV